MLYQWYTLSSLFPVFCSSCWWSQWRLGPGAVPDFRMLPSLPRPLCYLHPLFILYTWQPARQHCATGLQSRCSQSLFFYLYPSIGVCTFVSLSTVLSIHLAYSSLFQLLLPLPPPKRKLEHLLGDKKK